MEWLSHLFQAIKSPRNAFIMLFFSGAFLFFPFEKVGIDRPKFTEEYETHILLLFVFAASIIALELALKVWQILGAPFRAKQRRRKAWEAFNSINLNELCVLWDMSRKGMQTIRGDFTNPIMVSLRHKGCLFPISGPQNLSKAPHGMPLELYNIVRQHGYNAFSMEFRESPRFEDEVRRMVNEATDWRVWG